MHLNSSGVLARYDHRLAERAAKDAAAAAAKTARDTAAAARAAVRKASAPKALTGRSKCTMKSAGMCQGPVKYTKPVAGAAEVWTACTRGHHFFCPVCTPKYAAAHNC